MRHPAISRPLFILARLTGLAGAALTVGSIAVSVVGAVFWFFRYGSTSDDVGIVPLFFLFQIVIAAWVVWGVFKLDPRPLLRVLLLAGAFLSLACMVGTSCSRERAAS